MAIWPEFRRPFTTQQAYLDGYTESSLKWAVRNNEMQRLRHGVYVEGRSGPNAIENALSRVVNGERIASGSLAGVLYGLDIDRIQGKPTRPYSDSAVEVDGYLCTDPLATLLQLARELDDIEWEQVLESALRQKLVSIEEVLALRHARVRRVLKLRPSGAPSTESLLETLMVQLLRLDESIPTPTRQVELLDHRNGFIARVDLAWPELGIFLELDGQQHLGQPVYDASRQTRVVAQTGWLVGRFTWREVTSAKRMVLQRVNALLSVASNAVAA